MDWAEFAIILQVARFTELWNSPCFASRQSGKIKKQNKASVQSILYYYIYIYLYVMHHTRAGRGEDRHQQQRYAWHIANQIALYHHYFKWMESKWSFQVCLFCCSFGSAGALAIVIFLRQDQILQLYSKQFHCQSIRR